MRQVTIEKGISLPKGRGKQHKKYPFADMDVGDSFQVNLKSGLKLKYGAGKEHKANPKRRYAIRKVSGGWRCWRVK